MAANVKEVKVIRIEKKDLLGSIASGIERHGMRYLEQVFKRSADGHAETFAEEDVDFTIFEYWVNFDNDGNRIKITVRHNELGEVIPIPQRVMRFLNRKLLGH